MTCRHIPAAQAIAMKSTGLGHWTALPAWRCSLKQRQWLPTCSTSSARYMKVVKAPEYSFYWGSPVSDGVAGAAVQLDSSSPGTTQQRAPTATADTTSLQRLLVALDAVEGPWALIEFAEAQQHQMHSSHWLRLLFRLFVQLHENQQLHSYPQQLSELHSHIPAVLAATAAALQRTGCLNVCSSSANQEDRATHESQQQQQQQQVLNHQIADMMFAMAVHATDGHQPETAAVQGSSSIDDSSCGSWACSNWLHSQGCIMLVDAVTAYYTGSGSFSSTSSSVALLTRQDSVSLLWACGQMVHLQQPRQRQQWQQQANSPFPASTASLLAVPDQDSSELRERLIDLLAGHISNLIQQSNNTSMAMSHTGGSTHSSTAPTAANVDPWHPEDLTDAVVGLAATGLKTQRTAELLDAVAHEVYRQLSNRHSHGTGSFTVDGVVKLLRSYADLDYKDGPSLRMFDAVAGWLVKRIRARHVQAPSVPQQLAAVAAAYAALLHKSVVVPELLNALGIQAVQAAAAAISLHATSPTDYYDCNSSAYCHWRLADAAQFLRSHLQLAYAPAGMTLTAMMPAVLLHLEEEYPSEAHNPYLILSEEPGNDAAGLVQQEDVASLDAQLLSQSAAPASGIPEGTASQKSGLAASALQEAVLQRQRRVAGAVSALDILEALAAVGHHPGQQVLSALVSTAWSAHPHLSFSQQQLVSLLYSTAQLAATPADAAAVAAVADEVILVTLGSGTDADEWKNSRQQQQQLSSINKRPLPATDILKVLWSLVVLDGLDIARLGWLLVALASSGWEKLDVLELAVVAQACLMLEEDGTDMAAEVLPAELLKRIDVAWSTWSERHSVPAADAAGGNANSSSSNKCDAVLWKAQQAVEACFGPSASDTSCLDDGGQLRPLSLPSSGFLPALHEDPATGQDGGEDLQQHARLLLGAWVGQPPLQRGPQNCRGPQQQQQQQHTRPLGWQHLLHQAVIHRSQDSQPEGISGAACHSTLQQETAQDVLLLACKDEWYSTNEPQQLLGQAVFIERLATACWRQQQQQQQQWRAGHTAASAGPPACALVPLAKLMSLLDDDISAGV